jgi:hypothetical protein
MNRRYESNCGCVQSAPMFPNIGGFGGNGCGCSLPTLIILILIILQFSKKCKRTSSCSSSSSGGAGKLVDNSILFIIALFYLSCNSPCKTGY